ncbi:MAG: glycosyltransferase family 2 protein [Planctomycetota bacterium]|nr:glycosyltransferase family 2 protein [Planctomycetota bacterium]
MKLISIVTPCFHEEENVERLCEAVRQEMAAFPEYEYEHIFIDNCSQDRTVELLKGLAQGDRRIKIIVNTRNFGPWSPLHATLQARGDAIIPMAADFQDPPHMIADFLRKWEEGYKIVAAVKRGSEESVVMRLARRLYYQVVDFISEAETIKGFTGFGLYDRKVIEIVRSTGDFKPYFRGLVCQIGYPIARLEYVRPTRKRGWSKNSLYDLYCQAMNGITTQSKVPLRVATFLGLGVALVSFLIGCVYLMYKLIFWQNFSLGIAPVVCGIFFFSAVQMMFLGIIGEYIGAIHERVFQKWIVIERERINFDDGCVRIGGAEHRSGDLRSVSGLAGGGVSVPQPADTAGERGPVD